MFFACCRRAMQTKILQSKLFFSLLIASAFNYLLRLGLIKLFPSSRTRYLFLGLILPLCDCSNWCFGYSSLVFIILGKWAPFHLLICNLIYIFFTLSRHFLPFPDWQMKSLTCTQVVQKFCCLGKSCSYRLSPYQMDYHFHVTKHLTFFI